MAELLPGLKQIAGPPREKGGEALIEDNVIEGNHILAAEGLGIEILRASRNRIVNNTITDIRRRDPFPGNTLGPPPHWRDANGSGIWLSSGSEENQIRGNIFEEIASHAVVLEGDRNRVEARSAGDAVRDLGRGNRVSGAGSLRRDEPQGQRAAPAGGGVQGGSRL